MSTTMSAVALWGIWCVERAAWCTGPSGQPETFESQQEAQDAADGWKIENDWHVAHHVRPARAGVHDPLIGDGCMVPLTYEARGYPDGPEVAPVTQRDPECTADVDHPCDAGGRDDNDDPIPCARCARYEQESRDEALREYAVATVAERDPERYRSEMIDAGRGHLLGNQS